MGKVFSAMMLPVFAWLAVVLFAKFFGFPLANVVYTMGLLPFEILFQEIGVNIFANKLDVLISLAVVLIWVYIAWMLDRR